MTNLTSPDEFLALVLESVRSKKDLDAVHDCMRAFPPSNPPLFTFNSMDTIRNQLTVLHDGRSGMDYLVFKESNNSALTGTEAVFDVAGYVAAFSLPGHVTSDRFLRLLLQMGQHTEYKIRRALHRPHTLRQSVMITAADSKEFMYAVEALSCLATYLNQYATEGQARQLSSRTAYGLPAIDAQTQLFVHEHEKNGHQELEFPAYMDPFGRIMGEVRKKSFCYTTDNVVEYAETASATDNRYALSSLRIQTAPF